MGSKNKFAKEILKFVLKDRKPNQYFYDMFAGGFNIVDKVKSPRCANDKSRYLTALFKEMQKEDFKFCERIDEEKYKHIQKNKDEYPDWIVGFAGFNLSFGAKFFGTFARNGLGTDYQQQAQRNLTKQRKFIKDIEIFNLNYDEVPLKPNSIIYCDPPYFQTTGYEVGKFDHEKFYNWCREKHKEGHQIFISEYYMPSDFVCIWKKKVNTSLNCVTKKENKFTVEKLYTLSDDKFCTAKYTGLFF